MRKALIITTVSGFVPQFEMNNVKILQELGYEVHYASNFHIPIYGENNDRLKGTNIICHQIDFVRSPFQIIQNYKAFYQLKILLTKENFDLLHCHTPMGGVLGRLSVKQKKKKPIVIYTAHGFHFYKGAPIYNWLFFYPIERWLMRKTDILITITEEDYKRAKKWKLCSPKQIYYIPGVGIEKKEQKEQRKVLRKKMEISETQIVCLSVGELNKNKNQKIVISALSPIWDDKIKYFICGKGKQEKALKKQIRKAELEKQIHVLGYQENIKEFYQMADIFIIPSYREGLSVSLQEAMIEGLFIIASDIRGNRELVIQGKGGYLVKASDKKEMRKAIQQAEHMILKEPQKWKQIQEFNQERIKVYQKEEVQKEMRQVYGTTIKQEKGTGNKGE